MNPIPPSPQFPYSPEIVRQNSTLAIVSLVAGLSFFLGIPVIGSVIAVITGAMAMKEIRGSQGLIGGESMARIGLATGWFGVGIWGLGILCGLLAALLGLLPVIASVCIAAFPFLAELLRFIQ